MAKKNRCPRPSVGLTYLNQGEEIPGTGRIAEHDGWYDPENAEGFTWKQYREWVKKREEEWQASHQTAQGGVIFPIP
jgi:hypothetical protein